MASCITAFMSHNYSQHWKFMTRWETAPEYRAVICMQSGNYTAQPLLCSALPAAESTLSPWWTQVPVAAGPELDHPAPLTLCSGWLTMLFIKPCFSKQTLLLLFLHLPSSLQMWKPWTPHAKEHCTNRASASTPPLIIEDLLKCFCLPFFIPYGPLGNMTQCGH